MGVQIYTDSVWSLPLGAHATAQMSDGALFVVGYDGTNLVYALSHDGGNTWSVTTAITAVTLTALTQVHFDVAQNGDTLYGVLLNGNSGGPSLVPFKVAYTAAGQTVSVTAGSATSNIAGVTNATTNPGAGNTYASCTWDPDHSLLHVGVQSTGATNSGPQLYAFTTALALSYSLTGQVSTGIATGQVCAVVYVRGTLYIYGDGKVATSAPSASAYGALSAVTTIRASITSANGVMASLDVSQTPTQPCFAEANGSNLVAVTYDGTNWTSTVVQNNAYFGAGIQCGAGNDLYVVSGNGSGTNFYWKRSVGVWSSQQTIDATNGDRVAVPTQQVATGTLLFAYVHSAPANVYGFGLPLAGTIETLTHGRWPNAPRRDTQRPGLMRQPHNT